MPDGETAAFESPDYERGGLSELSCLSRSCDKPVFGIKRPSYFASIKVAERIRKHAPNVILFAVLRNPIERAVSAYFHNVKYGFVPPLPIEMGLKKILFDEQFRKRYKRAEEIIRFGQYAEHLSFYHDFRNSGQLRLFLHEDVALDPLACIRSAYSCLEVNADFVPTKINDRPQSVTYSLPRLRFYAFFNLVRFTYNSDRTRLVVRETSGPIAKLLRITDIIDTKFLARIFRNTKPKLSIELTTALSKFYSVDAQAVRHACGRDLPSWPKGS